MKISIRRMVVILLTVSTCIILLIGMESSYSIYCSRRDARQQESYLHLNNYVNQIDASLEGVETQLTGAIPNIRNEIAALDGNEYESYEARKRIDRFLENMVQSNSNIDTVLLLDNQGNCRIKVYNAKLSVGKRIGLTQFIFDHRDKLAGQFERKDGILEGIMKVRWQTGCAQQDMQYICVIEFKDWYFCAFSGIENYDNYFNMDHRDADNYFLVYDGEKLIYSSWPNEEGENLASESNKRMLYIPYESESRIPLRYVYITKDDYWTGFGEDVSFILWVGSGLMLIMIALIIIIKYMINQPIHELMLATRNIARGDYEYRLSENIRSKEFFMLNCEINKMAGDILRLNQERYEKQLEMQRRELDMLRGQIRPHFYLNALTMIKSMTYQNRDEDIRKYLDHLAKHMRYVFRRGVQNVTVGEELMQVQNYAEMQRIRFPFSVEVVIECPEDLKEESIAQMMIFSIVENSFKHALDLYGQLKIYITCRRITEETFRGFSIEIEDNGPGYPDEVLSNFYKGEELPDHKVGLSNVKRTLQLYYGREDLMKISNIVPNGAKTLLQIPKGGN